MMRAETALDVVTALSSSEKQRFLSLLLGTTLLPQNQTQLPPKPTPKHTPKTKPYKEEMELFKQRLLAKPKIDPYAELENTH